MKGNNSKRRIKRRNSYVRSMEMTRDLKKDEKKMVLQKKKKSLSNFFK